MFISSPAAPARQHPVRHCGRPRSRSRKCRTRGRGRNSATRLGSRPEIGVAISVEDQLGAAVRVSRRAIVSHRRLRLGPANVLKVNHPLTGCDEMMDSPAGMQTSSTVKPSGILTVAEVFWAYAGTRAIRTSDRVITVMRTEFFISILTGAVAPNAATLRPERKMLNTSRVEIEGGRKVSEFSAQQILRCNKFGRRFTRTLQCSRR